MYLFLCWLPVFAMEQCCKKTPSVLVSEEVEISRRPRARAHGNQCRTIVRLSFNVQKTKLKWLKQPWHPTSLRGQIIHSRISTQISSRVFESALATRQPLLGSSSSAPPRVNDTLWKLSTRFSDSTLAQSSSPASPPVGAIQSGTARSEGDPAAVAPCFPSQGGSALQLL